MPDIVFFLSLVRRFYYFRENMTKGRVLKVFDSKAVFENLDTGNCIVASASKEAGFAKEIYLTSKENSPDVSGPSKSVPFESIFGFYELLSGTYVALVVESSPYVDAKPIVIRSVKKIVVVPLFRNMKLLSEPKQRDEEKYLSLLYLAFTDHTFFYSNTYDVTLTQQKLSLSGIKDYSWSRSDHRFFWNRVVVEKLIQLKADEWIVPFMSGYVEFRHECVADEDKFSLLFISRRSRYRQGCRFTKRGLDEFGNPANFVETEQIIIFPDGRLSSFVQIRGSIPVKWSSPVTMKYDPVVYIEENIQESIDRAEKHVRDVEDNYCDNNHKSKVVFVNLVDMKKDQLKLGTQFDEVVNKLKQSTHYDLEYVWFDFHKECKNKGGWKNLSKLVVRLEEALRAIGFFRRSSSGEVLSYQHGVFRTNCMDNLDRTNVVQSLLARRSLLMQLEKSSLLNDESCRMDTPWKPFEKIYKSIWANNANAMSVSYAGTGALKVDFTRTGKRTFKGMIDDGINAVMRYYINNLTDGNKQDSIDLMLGLYVPSLLTASPFPSIANQESLGNHLMRGIVLMMIIFSFMLLITPILDPATLWTQRLAEIGKSMGGSRDSNVFVNANWQHLSCAWGTSYDEKLNTHLVIAVSTTLLVSFYIIFLVIKKGSKIGERMVVRPKLLPEPLPGSLLTIDSSTSI